MTSRQAGFTLIELLISITIFAMLIVMLFGGLQIGTRQIGRLTAQADRSAQIAVVDKFLHTQLAAAMPLAVSAGEPKTIEFQGRGDGVDFVSVMPESVAVGGLQVLSLGFVEPHGNTDGQILVGWRPLRDDSDAASRGETTVLLDHVREARFVYYGPPAPNAAPDWQDTWQDVAYLPLLVRVSVVMADGKRIPDIAVALRLSSTVAELRLNQGRRF